MRFIRLMGKTIWLSVFRIHGTCLKVNDICAFDIKNVNVDKNIRYKLVKSSVETNFGQAVLVLCAEVCYTKHIQLTKEYGDE